MTLYDKYQMLPADREFQNTNPVSGLTRTYRIRRGVSAKRDQPWIRLEVKIGDSWHPAFKNHVPSILQAWKRELKEKGEIGRAKAAEDTSV